jgi:hypothetical protein
MERGRECEVERNKLQYSRQRQAMELDEAMTPLG